MIIKNKLDKSFGPVGAVAGTTILLSGIVLVFFSLAGLILILLGAFVGLSSTNTYIDFDKKRVKFANCLFGFITIGSWVDVVDDMTLEIKKSTHSWRTYSRGNRTLDISQNDLRIVLSSPKINKAIPLAKVDSLSAAKQIIEDFSNKLAIRIITRS